MASIPLVLSCASGGAGRPQNPTSTPAAAVAEPRGVQPLGTMTAGPLSLSKWRLGNGLEIILAPDPAARSACYTTWFRVGSRHEDAGKGETGLAHLFEHLMFTQTRGAEEGDFDRKMDAVGATVNAMTSYDFTAYVDNMPPERLALAATLESDRMRNLALTAKQVETERDVVAEERLMVVEDDVDGQLGELLWKTAFRDHPYHWPVIGWMKDIKAVTRDKAVAFYRRFYAPNNAVVIVAGRFDEAQVLATLESTYGGIAPSPVHAVAEVHEDAPLAPARLEIAQPVPADRLAIATASPGLGHADRAAFDVLEELLTGGPSARLFRELVVEKELASSVSAAASETREPGLFTIWIQMRKGHHAPEAEAIVARQIDQLASEPVSEAELEAARNRLQTGFWLGLSSSEGKAEQLGIYEVGAGDYRTLFTRAEEHARVTATDVQRVAHAYLRARPRVVAVAIPGGGPVAEAEDDYDDGPEDTF